ncbi:(deoxy)nucleoside triphosphate pyrophosphohydrolase [Corynebacterium marinum]|uniref:8-oxo-dGTP diphosphatase n=1 Tax=Corynebacterium marinum DSM 44953 TaxID=1224162 RepID=A0A0B6TKS4_9CORY|nr:(deoxy)nucleoside triphosphate pyrophosphohydrolase [Corynebacterium marinum]AJK68568.1 mutT-like protein [Corynebacterium marinum DSM 44953]GGO14635.1 DNA mismatch repair protein MutT [Corynebacterium marinum]
MKKRINVTGAVLTDGDKVLAARRGPDKALPGFWEFPGGKIEAGETPEESLARELKEELLCQAAVGDYITTTEYEYDFGIVILSTYFCTLIEGDPQLTEHEEIRWIPAAELHTLNWAPADVPAVEIIAAQLGG